MFPLALGACWTDEGYRAPVEHVGPPDRPPLADNLGHSFDDARQGHAGLRCIGCSQSYHAHQGNPRPCPYPPRVNLQRAARESRAERSARSREQWQATPVELRQRHYARRRGIARRLRGPALNEYIEAEIVKWRATNQEGE